MRVADQSVCVVVLQYTLLLLAVLIAQVVLSVLMAVYRDQVGHSAFHIHTSIMVLIIIIIIIIITSCGAKAQQTPPRVAHRDIARFLGIDQKCNKIVPWSLHTFPENFIHRSSGLLIILLTMKQRNQRPSR